MGVGGDEQGLCAGFGRFWDSLEHDRTNIYRNADDSAVFANESFRAYALRSIKLGRLGRVKDIMGAVIYLAGDQSSLVTGTSLIIDGGWTAN